MASSAAFEHEYVDSALAAALEADPAAVLSYSDTMNPS
jgi:hypothetical protein